MGKTRQLTSFRVLVLAITHIFDQPQGGYSYSFDLRLDPMRLDYIGALKRLSTEELDLEDSQQTFDLTGKDVGNCKGSTSIGSGRWRRSASGGGSPPSTRPR